MAQHNIIQGEWGTPHRYTGSVLPLLMFQHQKFLSGISGKFLMSDVLARNVMLTELLFLFCAFTLSRGWKEVEFIIFKFLSSTSHPHAFWLSFQIEESSFAAMGRTYYFTRDRLLHLIRRGHFAVVRIQKVHCALLEIRKRKIQLIWNLNVKIWCCKRQQYDVNETDPSGNTAPDI